MEHGHICAGAPVTRPAVDVLIENSNQTHIFVPDCSGSQPASFDYQHLDVDTQEIRLIQFSPLGTTTCSDGEISLIMNTVSLKNPPPFLALSYVWGEPRFVYPITCNSQRLLLAPNLAQALRTIFTSVNSNSTPLYHRGDETFLWADGICINQKDNVEKSAQIPLMKDIYMKAKGVIAYIGAPKNGDPSDGLIATALSFGAKAVRPNETGEWVVPKLDWNAYMQLWQQPFFSRSWIFQEMVVAPYVLCLYGDEHRYATWSLDEFMALWIPLFKTSPNFDYLEKTEAIQLTAEPERIDDLVRIHFNNATNLEAWRYLRDQMKKNPTGLDPILILSRSRRAETNDQRDKIYSVMSLFTKDYRETLKIDYSSSNTIANTFVNFAESCIRSGFGMSLLEHAGTSQKIQGLPSWVPDWSFEPRYRPIPFKEFSCAGSTEAHISLSDRARRICIRGWTIGHVWMAGPAFGSLTHSAPIPSRPRIKTFSQDVAIQETIAYLWCKKLGDPECRFFGDEDFSDVIWRTLWLDQNLFGERAKASDRKYYDAWLEKYPRPAVETESPVTTGDEKGDANLFKFTCQHMKGRVLCLIGGGGTGRIGSLPDDAAKGDLVALFMGMRTPFAIRPVAGTDEFQIIGPCYIYGIMDGELVDEGGEDPQLRTGGAWKDFVIK
jgi:hypothetical protein